MTAYKDCDICDRPASGRFCKHCQEAYDLGIKKYIEAVKKTNWEKELDEYLETADHLDDCFADFEGQKCCLKRDWIRDFIKSLISSMKENNG